MPYFKKKNLLEYFVLVMNYSEFSLISPHLSAHVVVIVVIVLSMWKNCLNCTPWSGGARCTRCRRTERAG